MNYLRIAELRISIVRSSDFTPDPRTERTSNFLERNGAYVSLIGLNRTGQSVTKEIKGRATTERLTIWKNHKMPRGNLLLAPFIVLWILWVFRRLLKKSPGAVIASDFDALVPSFLFCLLTHTPLIYHPYDLYADNFQSPVPRLLTSLVRRLEMVSVGLTDALIIPDISRLRQYSQASLPQHIVEIVNTPGNLNKGTGDKIGSAQLFSTGVMNVYYAGVITRTRGLFELVGVIEREEGIKLTVAGFGEDEPQLRRVTSLSKNTRFIGILTHDEVIEFTRQCDVVVALYDPKIPNNVYASPNKLFEAMACGKPILVNGGTRLAGLVAQHDCGVVVDYEDADSIACALRKLRDSPDLRARLGRNGKMAYDSNYEWATMEKRLQSFFSSI